MNLKRIAVVGAAGKMGRGIALLFLQEMAREEAELTASVGSGDWRLTLIDVDEGRLNSLWSYFKPQLIKYAIQNINGLRGYFKKRTDLIENGDMIQAFVEGSLAMIRFSCDLAAVKGSHRVFEAAIEDFSVKRKIYQTLKQHLDSATYYTNTSSIPISYLDREVGLNHQIIGFHFYNPPPLQKLVELIPCKESPSDLIQDAQQLGRRLGKTLVQSHDVAGFIGNGHFMRELCYACERVAEGQSIDRLNRLSQQLLIRPMGIFQLADYVGLDVCLKILAVMECHIPSENFHCALLEEMVAAEVVGGQNGDGTQRAGIFQYQKGQPTAVYHLDTRSYEPLDNSDWSIPSTCVPWSKLVKDPKRSEKLSRYFKELFQSETAEAHEATAYLLHSKQIALNLVKNGVATTVEDVNRVLELGFSHLYGAVNNDY